MVWWRHHATPLEIVNHSGVTLCLGWLIPKIIVKEVDNIREQVPWNTLMKIFLCFLVLTRKREEPEQKSYIVLEGPSSIGGSCSHAVCERRGFKSLVFQCLVTRGAVRCWLRDARQRRRAAGTSQARALQCHFQSFIAGWHQGYKESGPRLQTRKGSCHPGRVRGCLFVYGLYAVDERKTLF